MPARRDSKRDSLLAKKMKLEEEKKVIDLSIQSRLRDPKKFLECDSAFTSEFHLTNEFTKKYEYKMQGKLKDVQYQV